jgi:hypothetical protein
LKRIFYVKYNYIFILGSGWRLYFLNLFHCSPCKTQTWGVFIYSSLKLLIQMIACFLFSLLVLKKIIFPIAAYVTLRTNPTSRNQTSQILRSSFVNIHRLVGLWCFQQYFSNIVETSIIGGGDRSTLRKPLTCHKSPTNFIT